MLCEASGILLILRVATALLNNSASECLLGMVRVACSPFEMGRHDPETMSVNISILFQHWCKKSKLLIKVRIPVYAIITYLSVVKVQTARLLWGRWCAGCWTNFF